MPKYIRKKRVKRSRCAVCACNVKNSELQYVEGYGFLCRDCRNTVSWKYVGGKDPIAYEQGCVDEYEAYENYW